jgi:hypothetical protein
VHGNRGLAKSRVLLAQGNDAGSNADSGSNGDEPYGDHRRRRSRRSISWSAARRTCNR